MSRGDENTTGSERKHEYMKGNTSQVQNAVRTS